MSFLAFLYYLKTNKMMTCCLMLFDKVSNKVVVHCCCRLLLTWTAWRCLSPLNNQFTAVFQGRGRIRLSDLRWRNVTDVLCGASFPPSAPQSRDHKEKTNFPPNQIGEPWCTLERSLLKDINRIYLHLISRVNGSRRTLLNLLIWL